MNERIEETGWFLPSLDVLVFDKIKSEEKVRKTFSLNKGVGKALDAFAAGHKLNKQDIIELALWDLFRKYN
ncbi:hypothetical protein M3196_15080 [Fictibacillus nanhaiensis]|uniref:hypothetical protein n=1 Tax=Fictibacillus nanhaiensis TaxID=742169 RepID=UPI00203EAFEE|nr:hypothetical protein [Fictibacillus nanhaiensis]MCM3732976.1 hypothetical protein [Fictibacillus nanhaiensis]